MSMGAKATVIFLMGPTASGKTDAACRLADEFNCEIVSVDSAMVYRGLDIGTAKPPPTLLATYPHHLIDLCDPDDGYSAARFRRDAMAAISHSAPCCIAGSTRSRPILAVLRTPHFTGFMTTPSLPRTGNSVTDGAASLKLGGRPAA